MIANFTIDQPAPLEINCNLVTMGGAILIVSKKQPLFVQHLSVFWGVLVHRKIRSPARKKNIGGKTWAGPPIVEQWKALMEKKKADIG